MSWFHWTILPFLLFIVQAEINELRCERTPLQVISIFDISNIGQFRDQQLRLIDTLRHLDKVTKGRQVNYALIVYHRQPVSLTPLSVRSVGNLDKVINQIETLNPRYHLEKSSVQALQTALDQISFNGQPGVKSLILLTHSDGLTSDSVADILDIKLKLAALNASIFLLSNEHPTPSLLHYTNAKHQIYSKPADLPAFYNAIDSTIGACLDDVQPNGVPTHRAFGVRSTNPQPTIECPSNQVDLMILLDTSGSVQRTFEREQNLAVELVNGLDRQSFGAQLQVSVIQFAADPTVVVGFRHHATKQAVLDRLRAIKFTGRITRIANAVEFGLQEMDENGNRDATKIFVLISDGSSLDYWHDVKKTGEKLRQFGATVFVASTSSDINFDEMLVYAGDNRNIFIGARDKILPLSVSALIQKCLSGNVEVRSLQSSVETKFTLSDQFLSKKSEEQPAKPIIGTVPNEAQPITHPESFFTRVKGPKEEAPSQLKKQFDDQSANNRNLFSELSTDEIIANTTEIDENEFEGSGQEVKLDESVVKLISTVSAQQQQATFANESAPSCNFDLIFVVEGREIEEQLSVVRKIVDRIPETLIPGQIQPLLAVNGKIANNHENNKFEFLETLHNLKSTEVPTNSAQLIEVIKTSKRPNVQSLLLVLSNTRIENIDQLIHQLSPQHVFILSNSAINNTATILSFADPQELNQRTIDLLLPCISASVEKRFNEFINAGRNSHTTPKSIVQTAQPLAESCENDQIEFFVVLSGAQSNQEALKAKVQLLNSLPVFGQPKRIRVSVSIYTNEAKLLAPLGNSQQKSDIVQRAMDQLERTETSTRLSLVAGLKLALTDILPSKRPKARLVGLLIVDENPVDHQSAILDIYQTLKGAQADVNLLTLGNEWDRNLALEYVGGNSSKIYTQPEKFIEDAKSQLFNCQNETRIYATVEDSDVFDEKISDLFRRSDNNAIQQIESLNTPSQCKDVDLILVVDTSTSVERAFNRQLQFALDLVKHLPDHGLESGQIQLGIASFFVQARGELPLGSLRQKDAILDTISSIKHTGGSTFIANGLKLAIEMVRKRTRPNAQLAIVLISDGNSQDEWQTVLSTAAQLRLLNADLYALTASHDFFFRELEIYADKNVFTDAQFDKFLEKIDSSILVGCWNSAPVLKKAREQITKVISTTTKVPTIPTTQKTFIIATEECKDDQLDFMLVLDTSTNTASQFYSQRNLIQKLVKVLPLDGKRVRIGLVQFNSTSTLQLGFSSNQSRFEVQQKIQQINYTGGNTSLVAGIEGAIEEIEAHSRQPKSRLIVLLVSAGNSRDGWTQVQLASKKLRQLKNASVFAVTLSNAYYFDELREYTGNERNIYADERVEDFIQDIGQKVFSCEPSKNEATNPALSQSKDPKTEFAARDEAAIVKNEAPNSKDECKFAKIDLILILDASTSRESVFEHQRELALSLIERLPISRGDTHVSIGLNSFVHVPTMRLTLGLGRDRTMVRKAIEEIEFIGGSTLTSQAIELAIKDLEKGRRRDAIQIIVLFNDGMSQDEWQTVEETSQHLSKANAELFGVALGDNVDLRELQLYIKRKERIYRDGAAETERFLQDVVSLLRNDTNGNCPLFFSDPEEEPVSSVLPPSQTEQPCEKPKVDIVALFDNSDNTVNMSDPKLNSNRYLLLDVLGSLPLGSQVHVAVFSFGQTAKLEFDLTSDEEKEVLVEKVEAIQPRKGRPSYASAVTEALEYYKRNHRSDARGVLLIVGDGQNATDGIEERSLAANQIRRTSSLLCQAVSSSKDVNLQTLIAYTGSISNVFNYDRNAEFAKSILQLATATNSECQQSLPTTRRPVELKGSKDLQPLKDIASQVAEASDKSLFAGDNEKLLKKSTVPSTTKPTEPTTKLTAQPTTSIENQEKLVKAEKPTKAPSTTSKSKPTAKLTNITTNCQIDLMLIIDASGSVNETLEHAKSIAFRLVEEFNVGPNSTHISIIKFASKARTLHSFDESQEKEAILHKLDEINLTTGSTTAIHTALLQAISEYTVVRGARLKKAQSLAVIFTDGFAQKDMSVEAALLREIASVYAVGINHDYPISRKGLEELTGDSKRVFTDKNIDDFYSLLKQHLAKCQKN